MTSARNTTIEPLHGITLSIVLAGSEDVLSTRESALTDVSPVFIGSTAA